MRVGIVNNTNTSQNKPCQTPTFNALLRPNKAFEGQGIVKSFTNKIGKGSDRVYLFIGDEFKYGLTQGEHLDGKAPTSTMQNVKVITDIAGEIKEHYISIKNKASQNQINLKDSLIEFLTPFVQK